MSFQPPRALLESARAVEYAVLDDSVRFVGKGSVFVDGVELGRVPRLAICEDRGTSENLLLYCDSEWAVLAVASYPSIEAAKDAAEERYSGARRLWRSVEPNAQGEATEFICSFCGLSAAEVEEMVEGQGGAQICNRCVRRIYEDL